MIANIIETVQKNLNFPPLNKIDPNDQKPKELKTDSTEKLGQAAIPAVLAAIYKYTRSEEGSLAILSGTSKSSWLNQIYSGEESGAVEKVAHYASVPTPEVTTQMEKIAAEAVSVIRSSVGDNATPEKLRGYISDQRHHILVFLPAEMQLGEMMNDNSLDDRTNKMEGPISNLMHSIENKLSGGGS